MDKIAPKHRRSFGVDRMLFFEFYEYASKLLTIEENGALEALIGLLHGLANNQIETSVAIDMGDRVLRQHLDVDDDGRMWWQGPYYISPRYWHTHGIKSINVRSMIQIRARYICARASKQGMVENWPIDRLFTGVDAQAIFDDCMIFVNEPEMALQAILAFTPLVPSEKDVKRYNHFNNRALDEMIIVGWRYLAVSQPSKGEHVSNRIVEAMRSYLENQGIHYGDKGSFGDRTLTNIATKIVSQWRGGNLAQSAFINSSPKKALS